MPKPNDDSLKETIKTTVGKISRFKDRGLGEQNTKASLIEPILESLGWDIRDPDEVHREFKPTSKDSPVDYALKLLRKPRLFVEAKGLGEDLADRKWIAQVLGYATVAGVEWCVLADGDEFRFYNATVPLDADEKLFCKLRLSEASEADAARMLRLISRRNMEENLINVLWSAHFVDRQVRESLARLIDTVDKRLIRLIRLDSEKLSPKEIADSIRRLDIRISQPEELPDVGRLAAPRRAEAIDAKTPKRSVTVRKRQKTKEHFGVTLAEIVGAGFLKPPVKLFRKYKGTRMEATLKASGAVEFQGTTYASCSTAAEAARETITGRKMNTNGWSFWQCLDANGKSRTLVDVRTEFIAKANKAN